ncbi:MAG: 1,4-dihydroxy-2-naphthoate octaprenyltransferase [Candidatus Thermofonsia Clade 1 bacterium]|uniref:1,4-dihydroxy-2-naphthoate octaprenyltransferase n=1 Tax=Candidatus Thermofonsia Clade 1 bacterium TaxID=2364210 RepID=A0A2M8P2Z6_9CHLR|nr:MAG: 1,4-dihydroxy-2-naphthoate octaprenyltransferase [Candidatus Thermofonsia Clade 1 bacterium]
MSRRWLSVVSPLALLALWELAVVQGWLDRRFIPQPSQVVLELQRMLENGRLWQELGISLLRITLGFLLGGVLGIALGLLIGISTTASALLRPIITAINPIPKILLIPFVVLAFGFNEQARVLSLAFSILPILLLDAAAAVYRIDPKYFEVARSYGASRWDEFWTVALPAALPSIMNSLKLGLAYSMTLIVGVELFGAQRGIGRYAWDAAQIYAVNRLGAGIVAIAITGWLLSLLIDMVTPNLIPWQPRQTEVRTEESPVQRFVRVWWRAARPFSFTAAVVPVLLGTAIAAWQGFFDPLMFALALIGSIALQAGTNLINDYYDYVKGADNEQSLGMGGVIQRGELTPRQVFWGGIAAFGLGSIIGLYIVSVAGEFILILGIISVLVGFFYTAGPAALAYIGLGEVAVFIFMGPVIVTGAYFVQADQVSLEALIASLPIGFLVAAILHANNLRDLENDRAVGKRTLATLLGRKRANWEYYLLIGGTYATLILIVLFGIAPWLVLLALLTLPQAYGLMQRVAVNTEPAALNPVLRKTAQLHGRFGMLLVGGWVLALMINLLNTVR